MHSHRILAVVALSAAFAQAQSTWWVSPTGSNANAGTTAGSPFQTVNHAATVAASGDIIRLLAGTYGNEQGNILLGSKNLSLVGAGIGSTIVKAHSTSDILLPAGLLVGPTIEVHRPAITVNGTARIDLRDMTLDQGFFMPATGRGYCLWVGGGADVVADYVDFTNARANPINGIQGPLAVNIRGDNAGDQTTATLRNCTVREYGKGGVVANFNAHVVMDDCRVRGFSHAPLGLAAQNAVQISRGATCELRRSQINDSWYEPGTDDPINEPTATGVLFFDPGSPLLIEDCNFGNCQAGIYAFTFTTVTTNATFRRNRIHAAQYGVVMDSVSGALIADNSIHVASAGDIGDAFDDASPANVWTGNNFSSRTVAGPYAIDGGTAVDATAKPGVRGFAAPLVTALPGGNAPIDMVVANLDADSDPDFAALCQGSTGRIVVGINTGGAFALATVPFGASSSFTTPMAIIGGEFNGAPGRDLAVVAQNVPPTLTENKVFVFANNGTGTFTLLHTHTLAGATSPNEIASGDVDGDGKDDLVVTDGGPLLGAGSATLLRNNGSGTGFTASTLPGSFTSSCRDAAIARLDAGVNADIAVVEGDGASGRVHLFAGDGLGGFVALGSPISTAKNANRVLATDLEGDGDQDLLVACSRDALSLVNGEVDVLDNNGAASFAVAQYRTERGATAMAAGDFDADADPDTQRRDVAVVDLVGGAVTVLGGYYAGAGFGTGGIAGLGGLPTGVGIGDVDSDGYADLVWCSATGSVSVARGEVQARADSYGKGSAGTQARIPYVSVVGVPALPTLPAPTFGFAISNARPLSVVVFALGNGPAPIVPNSILIASLDQTWFAITNANGTTAVPVPVPNLPIFLGISAWLQAGVFDPNATESFLPGIALTQAMRLRVGF